MSSSSSSFNELPSQDDMEAETSKDYADDGDQVVSSDPFNIAQAKQVPVETIKRWRQAALVLNASRRFRYTLDLKREEEKEKRRRNIRAHAQVIRAALLFKLAAEQEIGALIKPLTPSGEYVIGLEQLASMTRDHKFSVLVQGGGGKGLSNLLKTNLAMGISSDDTDLAKRRNSFGSNTYTLKKGHSFWNFLWEAWLDLTLITMIVAAIASLALGITTEGCAIFASSSPFGPVEYEGNVFVPVQANNAYIFPRFGSGLIMSCARAVHVHDDMLLASSEALAGQVTQEFFDKGLSHPPFKNNRKTSAHVVANVHKKAYKKRGRDNIWQLLQNMTMMDLQVSAANDVPARTPEVSYYLLSLFADEMEECTNLSPEGGVGNDNHIYLFQVKCTRCQIIDSELVRVKRSTRTDTMCTHCGGQGSLSVSSDKGTPLTFLDCKRGNASPLIFLNCTDVEPVYFSFLGEWEIYSFAKQRIVVFEFSEDTPMDVDPSGEVFSKWHSINVTETEHIGWSIRGLRAIIERRNHSIV